MSCLCLGHPRQVPNRLPAVCRICPPPTIGFRQHIGCPGHQRSPHTPLGHTRPNSHIFTLLACGLGAVTPELRHQKTQLRGKEQGVPLCWKGFPPSSPGQLLWHQPFPPGSPPVLPTHGQTLEIWNLPQTNVVQHHPNIVKRITSDLFHSIEKS